MHKRIRVLLSMMTLGLLLLMLSQVAFAQDDDTLSGTPEAICEAATPAEEPETREYSGAEDVLENGVNYQAIFCTSAGPVYIDLFEQQAPLTVNNFVFLAENGFYNNTTFHRVIADFMAQGGDPTATGSGGPGYRFEDEFVGYLTFDRTGLLAMANAGPGTNGSQFFITTAETPHLDFRHTIFGEVLEGQDNVTNIELRDPQTAASPGTSLDTVVIITDPAQVEADFEPPAPAVQADVETILDNLPDLNGLAVAESTGVYAPEAFAATLSDELQDTATTLFEENNIEYVATVAHENSACDYELAPFGRMGYTLHAFETGEDAQAVFESDALAELVTLGNDATSLESDVFLSPVYTWDTTNCDGDAIYARVPTVNGRFVTIAEIVLPADNDVPVDLWLSQVVSRNIYEFLFADVLRPEIFQ